MARPHRSVRILAAAGLLLAIAGGAGIVLGVLAPARVAGALPEAIDVGAVGGAMVALGGGALILGAGHLGIALAAARDVRWGRSLAVILAAAMAVLLLASAVAAVVSAVGAAAPAAVAIPSAVALLLLAVAYGVAAAGLIGRPEEAGGAS